MAEISSFIRGYHAYQDFWTPVLNEELQLTTEPDNPQDELAVAVLKSGRVVGHVPRQLAPVLAYFLQQSCNRGVAVVTGARVNRGTGYGIEVPCKYLLYGPSHYINKLKEILRI